MSLRMDNVGIVVDDLDAALAATEEHGGELVSNEIVRYEDVYRLCYVRGPGGVLVGLAEELGRHPSPSSG